MAQRMNILTRHLFNIALLLVSFDCFAQTGNVSYALDKATITKGQNLFQVKCANCHNFKQQAIGPNLTGITSQVSPQYLQKFIRNSQELIKAGDKRAVAVFNRFKVPMPPNPDLTNDDLHALLSFIHTQKAQPQTVDKSTAGLGQPKDNPIPAIIKKSDLVINLQQVATAPATSDKIPVARINQMTVLSGSKERLFLHDLRGPLYEMKDTMFDVIFDMSKRMPHFMHSPGHASGFGSFAFHPEFYDNGLLYTTHTEKTTGKKSDFGFEDSIKIFYQWVLTEWKLKDPGAAEFEGMPRELLRIDVPSQIHGVQQISFNEVASRDSADYGLLYIGIGDGGSAESGYSHLCNSTKTILSTIIRIDPAGNNSRNGNYGIPDNNPFAKSKDKTIVKEIFARGFRNPNRFTWTSDGKMLASDIGLANIEELNLVVAGKDYGWPMREGSFLLNYRGKMHKVYNLPAGKWPYINPVAQYDHDEGNAISGGFVYEGSIQALRGKYVFGDIVKGRLFYVEAKELQLNRGSAIKEFNVSFNNEISDFLKITNSAKADLRLGRGPEKELYIFTKTDGKIWKVTGCTKENESGK